MSWEAAKERSGVARGKRDLAMLDAIVNERCSDSERSAFEDMADRLRGGKQTQLTDTQRMWAREVAERLGVDEPEYENLASSGKVARGREVATIPMLERDKLPMHPPRRKP